MAIESCLLRVFNNMFVAGTALCEPYSADYTTTTTLPLPHYPSTLPLPLYHYHYHYHYYYHHHHHHDYHHHNCHKDNIVSLIMVIFCNITVLFGSVWGLLLG